MRPAVPVVLIACMIVGGCGRSEANTPDGRAHAAVCAVAAAAQAGDIGQARDTFFDNAHDQLHDLAGRAGEVDRRAAAELLVTKQRVESSLASDSEEVASQANALAHATAAAITAVGGESPEQCD